MIKQTHSTPSIFARPSDVAVRMEDFLSRRIAIKVSEPEVLAFGGQLRPAVIARVVVLENERGEAELTDLGLVDMRSMSMVIELGRKPGQWFYGMLVNSDRGLRVADCAWERFNDVLSELERRIDEGDIS